MPFEGSGDGSEETLGEKCEGEAAGGGEEEEELEAAADSWEDLCDEDGEIDPKVLQEVGLLSTLIEIVASICIF